MHEAEVDKPFVDSAAPPLRGEVASPEPQRPSVRRLFFGDDGLRAGWSVLLFVLLAAALIAGIQLALVHTHLIAPPHRAAAAQQADMHPRSAVIGESIAMAGLVLAALIMSFIERRPFRRYGFTAHKSVQDFSLGLFWGFTCLSLLVGLLWLTHTLAFDGVALSGRPALLYAAKWGAAFLPVGLFEEFLFRGYLQYTVARGVAGIVRAMDQSSRYGHVISFWVSAFIFSVVLFIVGHLGNAGETFSGILAVGLAGTVFAFSLYRTGSLWWGVGFHSAWDWAQSYFYGTADSGTHSAGHFLATHPQGSALISGSSAGPEGSLLVIPVLLVVALIIQLTLPQRVYPVTADQSVDGTPAQLGPAEHLHSL